METFLVLKYPGDYVAELLLSFPSIETRDACKICTVILHLWRDILGGNQVMVQHRTYRLAENWSRLLLFSL